MASHFCPTFLSRLMTRRLCASLAFLAASAIASNLLATASWGARADKACLSHVFENLIDGTEARGIKQSVSTDVFTVHGVMKGPHGGRLLIVERKVGWSDLRKNFSEDGADLTPDLRLLPTVLGEKGARFFGYRILSDKLAIIPDAQEVQGAIEAFNRGLPPDSPIRIATRPASTHAVFETDHDYVHAYIKDGTLPMSTHGRQFFHDMSGHAMQGFFDDNRITWFMRKRAKIWIDYLADRKRAGLPMTDELKKADQAVMEEIGSQIDGLGQGIGATMSAAGKRKWKQENQALAKRNGLTVEQLASLGVDKDIAQGSNNPSLHATAGVPSIYQAHRLTLASESPDIFYKDILPPGINVEFQKYLTLYKKEHPQVFEPLGYDPEKSIARIEDAAQKANGQQISPAKLSGIPLLRPYVARMNHLNQVIGADPYYESYWNKLMQRLPGLPRAKTLAK